MVQKIKIFLGIAVMAAVLFGGLTFSQSAFAGNDEKVTICHVDQKTGEQTTISVKEGPAAKHLNNHLGDYEGECVATCEECFIEVNLALNNCVEGDYDCALAAFNAFGECTLTCQGDFESAPQQCINDAAPALADCSVATDEGINACIGDWLTIIETCASS